MRITTITRWFAAGAFTVLLAGVDARAQDYPVRPIQVIVPFAGGSASDVVTRIMLDRMAKTLRLFDRTETRDSPNVIVINSRLPPKTLPELVDYAKQHPRELNYGSVGVGSSQHLAGAYFDQIAGVELVHVPYRNIAQYTPDFIGGQVPLGFQFLPNVIGMLQSGDARALAVTTAKRMTALPDLPTAAEAGVNGYETFGWLALLGPSGMPRPVVDRIYRALEEAVNDPAVRSRFIEQGAEPMSPGPEALQKFIAAETAKWKTIIQKAGIEPM